MSDITHTHTHAYTALSCIHILCAVPHTKYRILFANNAYNRKQKIENTKTTSLSTTYCYISNF